MNKKILVTGGAGYIGTVVVSKLLSEGFNVIVIDDLSRGKPESLGKDVELNIGNVLDKEFLHEVFSRHKIDTVMHFADLKNAGESMVSPETYSANISGIINLLNAMCKFELDKLIFSSSAAVYGDPQQKIVDENHPTVPINFYGFTKLEAERIIDWYTRLKRITAVSLRYFNVAGDGGFAYVDPHPGNIFPILAEVLLGKRSLFQIFGSDYDTPDGTCIRDYIHVKDIASAHVKALNVNSNQTINIGTSAGYSVKELIHVFENVSGKKLATEISGRRPGDPDRLVASNQKAKEILGWQPEFNIDEMVSSTLSAYQSKSYIRE